MRLPGGFHSIPKTIFEELDSFEIVVPKEHRQYPYFAVFDMESVLKQIEDRTSAKLCFTQRHIPISVSINSNVPSYQQPFHIVNSNLDILLERMIEYLRSISDKAGSLIREKLQPAFATLQQKLNALPASTAREQPRDQEHPAGRRLGSHRRNSHFIC